MINLAQGHCAASGPLFEWPDPGGGLDVLAVRDEIMRRLFVSAVAILSAFGWWNLGFIIGTVLLVPLGSALESIGPHGPDAGGGAMAALLLGYSALRSSCSSM